MRNYTRVSYDLNGKTYKSEKLYDLIDLEAELETALVKFVYEVKVSSFYRQPNGVFCGNGSSDYIFVNKKWMEA